MPEHISKDKPFCKHNKTLYCEICDKNKEGVGELYNKGLLIMVTMKKHKCSKEKATKAVEQFLENENKRIPDVDKVIDEVLSKVD